MIPKPGNLKLKTKPGTHRAKSARSLTSQSADGGQRQEGDLSSKATEQVDMGSAFHEDLPDFDHKSRNPYSAAEGVQREELDQSAGQLTGSIQEITYLSVESTVKYQQKDDQKDMEVDNLNHLVVREELIREDTEEKKGSIESKSISYGSRKAPTPVFPQKVKSGEVQIDDSRSAVSAQAFIDDYRTKYRKFDFTSLEKLKPSVEKTHPKNSGNIKELYHKLKVNAEFTVTSLLSNREDLMWLYSYNSRMKDLSMQVTPNS